MEPDPPVSAPSRVEAYLDQILIPLAPRLSPFHQNELRRELREHLWARVDAYRELGQSEQEAVTEALRQFGGAKDFLRQWQREWQHGGQRTEIRDVWGAMQPALYLSPVALLLACLPIMLWIDAYPFFHSIPWLGPALGYSPLLGETLFGIDVLLLPALLGFAIARRSPQRAGLGTFLALSAEVGVGGLLYWISKWLWPTQALVETYSQPLFLEAIWIPITCVSAALSSRWLYRLKSCHLA